MTNTDKTVLLPCPLCGNAERPAVVEFDGQPYVPGFMVRCNAYGWDGDTARGCGCSTGWAETEEEAIEAWNRRASRTQEPAEWQVEAANAVIWPATEWPEGEVYCRDVAVKALRAASITPPAPERSKEEVGVKPLEWDDDGDWDGGECSADTIVGQYFICASMDVQGKLRLILNYPADGNIYQTQLVDGVDHAEARAFAFADYEQRILSALEPSPIHKGEVIGWAFDIATRVAMVSDEPAQYTSFEPRISFDRPSVPEGSIRNLRPLYASPHPVTITPEEGVMVTDAARDVLAERKRQIEAEGWTPQHDDEHSGGEMARAAACYALGPHLPTHEMEGLGSYVVPDYWPWAGEWWKPKDRRVNLVRAGALILAEIERLDRAAALSVKPGEQG